MGQVIAINNQKGGVGKTTTCVNLAACLGASGYSTLIVDMDPQANATSSVGVDHRALTSSLYQTLIGLQPAEPINLHRTIPNVSILPSCMQLAGAELELQPMENREGRLRRVLEGLPEPYDYILIDSPPSLNQLSINALAAAQSVLIPVQAEFLALEGLAHVMNTINLVRQGYNPALELLGLVVTLYDGRTRLAGEVVRELQSAFAGRVFSSRIVRSIRLSEAPSHGKPIIYYDSRSAGADAYMKLCKEVVHACEQASTGSRP